MNDQRRTGPVLENYFQLENIEPKFEIGFGPVLMEMGEIDFHGVVGSMGARGSLVCKRDCQ